MSDSGRVIGECRHGRNPSTCERCEAEERFQKLTRDMGPLPTTMGPTTAEVARAEAATLRAALARLVAACERSHRAGCRTADAAEFDAALAASKQVLGGGTRQ
jgi:hypothetical protein